MTDTLAARVALSLGWYKQWGMPLWYDAGGTLIRTGLAWGYLPSVQGLRGAIQREVARRNLQYTFIDALSQVCGVPRTIADDLNPLDAFALLCASPEQIARAWLAIVEDVDPMTILRLHAMRRCLLGIRAQIDTFVALIDAELRERGELRKEWPA